MELHQIRYFLALARSLNFTRAAEQCNVTQPALTKAIQKLELELGGVLIHRERQLTQLTDLGKLVLPMLERTYAAAESVRASAGEFQRHEIAPLKIALASCICASILEAPLKETARFIPGLQVELLQVEPPELTSLLLSGEIGAASANWFRARLEEAHLSAGDIVLLSSPGGELNQAVIMGEIIRSLGLATAVGVADASGHVRPAYCASACVLVYAGGKTRYGIEGSALGVHRFVTSAPVHDPVADTQRVTGAVLGYMTKMGISSAVVEAMSETRDVRWLGTREASAMNLITDPVGAP